MSNEERPPGDEFPPRDEPSPQSQEIRHSQVSALVPKAVARGVFSTGAVVLQGAHEFIIDFLLRMTMPHQVAARVVIAPSVLGRFITALRENLGNFQRTFQNEPPPGVTQIDTSTVDVQPPSQKATALPAPGGTSKFDGHSGAGATPTGNPQPPDKQESTTLSQNSVQDLYDQLKMPDEMLCGAYANAVMIGHTATEFSFDFITTFFPRSAVSARVYMSAGNVPRFLSSITHAFEQYQAKVRQQQPPPPPPENPPPFSHPENDG